MSKKYSDKEYRKILKELGFEKPEDEPLTEQEKRQIIIYTKIIEEEKTMLEILTTKIDELNEIINEKKVCVKDNIKKNSLAYISGAFVGGLIAGFLFRRQTYRQ